MQTLSIIRTILYIFPLSLLLGCAEPPSKHTTGQSNVFTSENRAYIRAVNGAEIAAGRQTIAIRGATLIDGTGAAPLADAAVLIKNNRIDWVGKVDELMLPEGAEIVDAQGLALLPGLIDAHYHLNRQDERLPLFLSKGITTVRDPGAWIEDYDRVRASGTPIPRLYLTGPHLDRFPPAYPHNSYILQGRKEARVAVGRFAEQGASAIKVYFRLSLGQIEEICQTAHSYGIPVTAHLEITHAGDAIRAGLDGIEHITSFGTALLPYPAAEAYRQRVLADNNARRRGRYEIWDALQLQDNTRTDSLIQTILQHQTFICPTLGAFEKRPDRGDSLEVSGFQKMMAFTRQLYERNARLVVGSHSWVPYAPDGLAFAHEMDLLTQCGLSNLKVITAATLENARFFRIEDKLGSIEAGKLADLILVEGDPLADIRAMERVRRVMLNGVWVK